MVILKHVEYEINELSVIRRTYYENSILNW
jgi:hypothetical protein